MNEIEVKVLGIDVDSVRKNIVKMDGKLVKREYQENYFYGIPMDVENRNGYIRIRKIHNMLDNSNKVLLCIKKIISQNKYRETEEHEFEVSNFDECQLFLKASGINFYSKENKHRESYLLEGALIEIDTWDKTVFPEPYLEIEAENELKIFEILSLLEIPEEKATSKTLEQIKLELGID